MARIKKFYSEWLVKEDEFHPDLKIAAREADRASREAARKLLKTDIARLEERLGKSSTGSENMLLHESLKLRREQLAMVEQDIKDHEPDNDPEE